MPAAAVQTEHEHCYEALAQRILAGRVSEVVDNLRVPAQGELGIPVPLQRSESQVGEPLPLCLGERSGQPRQCLAPPPPERITPRVSAGTQLPAVPKPSRFRGALLEQGKIQFTAVQSEAVTTSYPRYDAPAEYPAQPRHVRPHDLDTDRRNFPAPHAVEDRGIRSHATGMDRQNGEHCLLQQWPKIEFCAVLCNP